MSPLFAKVLEFSASASVFPINIQGWFPLELTGLISLLSKRRSVLGVHWKDWCWSWSANTLATWCKELTPLKRPWCWERLRTGGEGDDRGWDGWMASPTQWIWVWVDSSSWWWIGRSGMQGPLLVGLQRVRHDWATELNWYKLNKYESRLIKFKVPISH